MCSWGYRSVSGEIVVRTESGVFKTRTVQRKAYDHRWHEQNMDMCRGGLRPVHEEGIMPAVDIGMEMPEVHIPRAPCTSELKISRGMALHRIARAALRH